MATVGADEAERHDSRDGFVDVERLRARVAELEEENDVLALSATHEPVLLAKVDRLTKRVEELEKRNDELLDVNRRLSQSQTEQSQDSESGVSRPSKLNAAVIEDPAAPFVVPGDRAASVRRVTHSLLGCHMGTNVLCAHTCPTARGILASGGADKSLLVSKLTAHDPAATSDIDEDEGQQGPSAMELHRLRLPAPILSMDFCPKRMGSEEEGKGGLLLAGSMDGASYLVRVDGPREVDDEDGDDRGDKGKNGVALLASMKDHAKYVVGCRWAPDGSAFVTASHDKVVTLYTLRDGGDGVGGTGYEQATRLYFAEAVESVEFVSGEGGALELVVSARGLPHLTYVNVETLQQRQVSLNEKEWDTHVSFTVMSLAASSDRRYILAGTDKSRVFLWRAGSNARIRTLMGHTSDDYFQPRVAWEPSGLFSYCNSSLDHDVHVHCLASGRVVERLKGHGSVVRDLYHDPSRKELVTASYDKSVKVWGR